MRGPGWGMRVPRLHTAQGRAKRSPVLASEEGQTLAAPSRDPRWEPGGHSAAGSRDVLGLITPNRPVRTGKGSHGANLRSLPGLKPSWGPCSLGRALGCWAFLGWGEVRGPRLSSGGDRGWSPRDRSACLPPRWADLELCEDSSVTGSQGPSPRPGLLPKPAWIHSWQTQVSGSSMVTPPKGVLLHRGMTGAPHLLLLRSATSLWNGEAARTLPVTPVTADSLGVAATCRLVSSHCLSA